MEKETNTPTMPPIKQISTASIKNCCKIFDLRAPIAIRTPISRVRSVTDTSIMFITPIPPTTKEITAILEIKSFMVPVLLSMVCLMLSLLTIKKSSVPWRAVSSSVKLFCAISESAVS